MPAGTSFSERSFPPSIQSFTLSILLETIREELGELFTESLGYAWAQALEFITSEMTNWKEVRPKV